MTNHRTALLFSGGGAHYVGMGRAFYNEYEVFRMVIEEAGDILKEDVRRLCFDTGLETLSGMYYSQIAIYTVSVGMYRVFQQKYGKVPCSMAGHSLGEYSALTCAGVCSFEDGLKLVRRRGELLDRIGQEKDGRMMAVNGLLPEEIRRMVGLLQHSGAEVYISNYNSPRQIILSGTAVGIAQALNSLQTAGGQGQLLPIPACSHCPLMNTVIDEFRTLLQSVTFNDCLMPVYANITGLPYSEGEEVRTALALHLVQPVYWEKTLRSMHKQGTDLFIEIGPQGILKHLNNYIDPGMSTLAFDEASDRLLMDAFFERLHHLDKYQVVRRCRVAALAHPNENKDSGDIRLQEEIKKAFDQISDCKQKVQDHRLRREDAILQCLESLDVILTCKGIGTSQRKSIFEKIAL